MRPVTVLLLVAVYETTRALLKRGALIALRRFWAYELRREMRN